jgi:predicted nucleic acid-binding Zn ribbon protein
MTEPSENTVNLEWHTTYDGLGWIGEAPSGRQHDRWEIVKVANRFMIRGPFHFTRSWDDTLDAAKALAQRLQDVLSGTGEAEECGSRTLHQHWRQINGWKFCPLCGRLLKPEDAT